MHRDMKTHLPVFLISAVIMLGAASGRAQTLTNSFWNSTLSSAAGGTKTAISIFATGDYTNGYVFFSGNTNLPTVDLSAIGIALSGAAGSPAGAWSMADTNFAISPIGYATNLTRGTSSLIDELSFNDFSSFGGSLVMTLGFSTPLTVSNNVDSIAWVFDVSPAEFEIDLAFANFNPGTYNIDVDANGNGVNLEGVPEPSTYALLALSAAGLGGYVLRRRRR